MSIPLSELQQFFKELVGFEPHGEYQLKPAFYLVDGKSIILRAPTGSGKSEALLSGYLWALFHRESFPRQMIAALPMRALVDSLAKRLEGYIQHLGVGVAALHGQRITSPLFLRELIVTTIDQVVAAYTCTPLSVPVRHGNITSGAVASAFLAFDEVHTFDPERALQATLLLADHSYKMGLPIGFMSATLPDRLVEALQKRFKAELVDVEKDEVPVTRKRMVRLCLSEALTPDHIRQAWDQAKGSLLVVCNTVDRARTLYEVLRTELPVQLLHARFLESDRRRVEEGLHLLLGKKPSRRGILIATQIVEVGLDISTTLLLTEVAPIDALIQRAGRVARWGGDGEIWVFGVPHPAPYEEELLEITNRGLREHFEVIGELNWDIEKKLVNEILNNWYGRYLTPQHRGRVLHQLAEGAFRGSRQQVENAVRENLSCEVSIHDRPGDLGPDVWRLPRVKVPVSALRTFVANKGASGIWRVTVDDGVQDNIDQRPEFGGHGLRSVRELVPNDFYVLSPTKCKYDSERGLLIGEPGEPFNLLPKPEFRKPLEGTSVRESWVEHSGKVLAKFYDIYEPSFRKILRQLAKWWDLCYDQFRIICAFAIAAHDLGKLGYGWQTKIGWQTGEIPLAHSGDRSVQGLPPHATVSANALSNLFGRWQRLGIVFQNAVAHHHSVRAVWVPRYRLVPGWESQVNNLLTDWPELRTVWQPNLIIASQAIPSTLSSTLPSLTDARAWRTYVVVSRLLRFSDWVATGGSEDVLFHYEDRLADV